VVAGASATALSARLGGLARCPDPTPSLAPLRDGFVGVLIVDDPLCTQRDSPKLKFLSAG
jgi:hypothetical protein